MDLKPRESGDAHDMVYTDGSALDIGTVDAAAGATVGAGVTISGF